MGPADHEERSRRKLVRYDSRVAARIVRRLARGEHLTRICCDPGMPSPRGVQYWCRNRPDFRDRYEKARRDFVDRRMRICERLARGEALTAICRDAGMPGRRTVHSWVRSDPAFRRCYEQAREKGRRLRRPYDPAVAEKIFSRIALNENLKSICRDPHMPALSTVMGWLRRYPDFRRGYRRARRFQWFVVDDLRIEARYFMVQHGFPLNERLLPTLVPHNRGWPPIFEDMR